MTTGESEFGGKETRLLVVGGQSRNVGKTALVVDLIRAFPQAEWTAVKITQYGHGVCAVNGDTCSCAPREHAVALNAETDPEGPSDTSRMLAAGARRALWLRTQQGRLDQGLPLLRQEMESQGREPETAPWNWIVESNSLLGFLQPRLYLAVLDPAVEDFKPSARRFLSRADAYILRRPLSNDEAARLREQGGERPVFNQAIGEKLPEALAALVRKRFLEHKWTANG